MKTREQIERELEESKFLRDKKEWFINYQEALKQDLSRILADFKKEKENITVEYQLGNFNEIKDLKSRIEKLDIPKEITINRNIKHSVEKVSYKILVGWALVSFLCITWALYYAFSVKAHKEKEIAQARQTAKMEAYQELYNELPPQAQGYLQNKYPSVFKKEKK